MAICDCCGLEVADLEAHYPCDCKECFRRLWLVSFVCANHVETHIASKVTFEAEKYTITYIDGSTTFMQADTVESFTIQPFKVGIFKLMSLAEREKVIATGYDYIVHKGQVSKKEALRQADAIATAIDDRAVDGPLSFFIDYMNGGITEADGDDAMALAAAFPQEWAKYLKSATRKGKSTSAEQRPATEQLKGFTPVERYLRFLSWNYDIPAAELIAEAKAMGVQIEQKASGSVKDCPDRDENGFCKIAKVHVLCVNENCEKKRVPPPPV